MSQTTGRQFRTILIVDTVESTQILQRNELSFIQRYRETIDYLEKQLGRNRSGRVVKRLGDGAQLDFLHVTDAVDTAFALRRWNTRQNEADPKEDQISLRIAIHYGAVYDFDGDIDGQPVLIATRMLELANPDEVVVSAEARVHMTAYLDADVTDLGDRYVKHIEQPIRTFRLGPSTPQNLIQPTNEAADLRPTIAVIPFETVNVETDNVMLGQIIANELIGALSQSRDLNVISRLSTTAFHGRNSSLHTISTHLKTDYVLSGIYQAVNNEIILRAELADCRSEEVLWSDRLQIKAMDLLTDQEQLIDQLIEAVASAVISRELERSRTEPLPTLKNYTLLLGAISLMHRLSRGDFQQSREMLETIIGRATRQAIPRAWLAKWHVLRVEQGWSDNPEHDTQLALENTQRALDTDPRCSLALTVDGLVHTNRLKQFDIADERYQNAIEINPNESLAWLLRGTLHAFIGEGEKAVSETQRALRLSPLDPHRYFYESLSATAFLAAHRYDDALEMANRSLRLNRTHTSTLRVIIISQWSLGRFDEARTTASQLLELEPHLTIKGYRARSPSADFDTGQHWSRALHDSGIPE